MFVLLSLAIVPGALASYIHPVKQGVSTSSRAVHGTCALHAVAGSQLAVSCKAGSSADVRYTFTVARQVHGIVTAAYRSHTKGKVTVALSRSGTRATVTVHVPAGGATQISGVTIQYYS